MAQPASCCRIQPPPGSSRSAAPAAAKPQGDGGKLLCSVANLEPPCIVYSLGSRMHFEFEEEILKKTQCHVSSCIACSQKLSGSERSLALRSLRSAAGGC